MLKKLKAWWKRTQHFNGRSPFLSNHENKPIQNQKILKKLKHIKKCWPKKFKKNRTEKKMYIKVESKKEVCIP